MADVTFKIFRGTSHEGGGYQEFTIPVEEGMVVLDAVHYIQAHQANDLAVRWNCKAGKCGSCGGEVNGKPKLMCMTRLDELPLDRPVTIRPMRTFPVIKDLVCDVSWNYEVNKTLTPFTPREDSDWLMYQQDMDRGSGVSQVHRVLLVSRRLPCSSRARQEIVLHWAAVSGALGSPRDAPHGFGQQTGAPEK